MIPYERRRYACGKLLVISVISDAMTDQFQAVKEHMQVKRSYELSSQSISAAQGLIMTFGLLGALFLGIYQVVDKQQSIGRFTTLLVYWAQLQSKNLFMNLCRGS